jgi:hypothetical protein
MGGRADLGGTRGRPFHLLFDQVAATLGPSSARCGVDLGTENPLGAELLGLWAAQADQGGPPRRAGCRPGPGSPADASGGHPGSVTDQEAFHYPPRQDGPASTRPGVPRLHGGSPEPQVGVRLHLLLHLVRGRLRGVRDRRVLSENRGLESGTLYERSAGGRYVEHVRLDQKGLRS